MRGRVLLTFSALLLLSCILLTACTPASPSGDVTGTKPESETIPEETDMTTEYMTEAETGAGTDVSVPAFDALMADLDAFPITFSYGGNAYKGFAGFTETGRTVTPLERGTRTDITLTHPDIPLTFTLETVVYPAESAYEYVVSVTNDGTNDSAVLSGLGFEMTFPSEKPVLSGIGGDAGSTYTPYETDLARNRTVRKESTSGRPTHGNFPYFNLSTSEGCGSFIALGWPGTWEASFSYDRTTKITTVGMGQRGFAAYLKPGETARTPRMAFVTYEGLSADEQTNAWRHYFINDVMRKIDGELTPTTIGISTMSSGMTSNKVNLILSAYEKHGIPLESLWLDAGWYTGASGEAVSWPSTGTLDMDRTRFPDGMSSIGKWCRDRDMLFLLWFEPENVRLDKAAFLRGQPGFKSEWLLDKTLVGTWLEGYLMNLGDPDCRAWVFDKVCKVIDESGINVYRTDFNNDPASAWASADGKDRKGMTENLYVQGYLALWDAIIEKYPYMMLDACASGGGRNDLESMKRAVPLHYSDWFDGNGEDYDTKSRMTQALFSWFPYFKNQVYDLTLDKIRMNYAPWSIMPVSSPIAKDAKWDLLKQGYDEYQLVRGYFFADYYQLTPYTLDADRWNAWEFFDPAAGSGYASVWCGAKASKTTLQLCLKGLDPDVTYTVKDLDGLVDVTAKGSELLSGGITVTVPDKPYCAILLISENS